MTPSQDQGADAPSPTPPADLEALIAKAKAATPGPWTFEGYWLGSPTREAILWYTTADDGIHAEPADAAYIAAASPDVVLSLCEEIKRLRAAAIELLACDFDGPSEDAPVDSPVGQLREAVAGRASSVSPASDGVKEKHLKAVLERIQVWAEDSQRFPDSAKSYLRSILSVSRAALAKGASTDV